MKFLRGKRLIFTLTALEMVGAVLILWTHGGKAGTEYFTAVGEMGSLRTVVAATGVVQTQVTVQVGSQVSGQVVELDADFNSIVKRGQLLARIDPRTLEAQRQSAEAALTAARARLSSAEAGVHSAAAALANASASRNSAIVTRDNTALLLNRALELHERGLLSGNEYDVAKAEADSASARNEQADAAVAQSVAQQAAASAQVDLATAQLDQAQADLDRARLNLEYANIYSPVDGVVISRNVDVGQTLASSIQSPTLFTIANDLTRMRVSANIDEADIGNISDAADVRFTVDAWRDDIFRGRIEEIRLSPTVAQNVVTYSVLISVDNTDLKLKPGMTANVTITVDRRDNVLKVPNLALHYVPVGASQQLQRNMPSADTEEDSPPAPQQVRGRSELAPGQKWDPAQKLRLASPQKRLVRSGRVWVLNAQGIPEARSLVLGMTDGTFTEVISGSIIRGQSLIIRDSRDETRASQPRTMNPLLPQTRGGRSR